MIQAIIVKNPKWEPFDKVSDAFKKLDPKENPVLVVRGRCKEKTEHAAKKFVKAPAKTAAEHAANLRKEGKSPEVIKAAIAAFKAPAIVALLLLCFGFSGIAQQSLTGKLPATTLSGFTTNWTAGNGVFGWNMDQKAVFQLTAIGTNTATTSGITIPLDCTDNGTDWVTNRYNLSVVCNGTNAATSITILTNLVGGKFWRFGGYSNTNAATNAVSIPRFTISI